MSRPSIFTQAIADKICERLALGESLRKICLDADMPGRSTLFRRLRDNEEFRNQYARAREDQADAIFDECLDIADDGTNDFMGKGDTYNGDAIQRSRLQVDTRKWMAGKMRPKKYGDKTLIGSDPDNPLPAAMSDIDLARLIVFLLAKATKTPTSLSEPS